MISEEIWKKVDHYNYEVSNLGRIRNMNTKHILKPSKNKKGYFMVDIGNKESRKYKTVHSLVAEYFIGKKLNKSIQINHKDGNKSNNSIMNLEYCSPRENIIHSINTGLVSNKLNLDKVKRGVDLFNSGVDKKQIAKELDISRTVLNNILSGKTYTYSSGIKYERLSRVKIVEKFSKLNIDTVIEIRKELSNGKLMAKEIALKYGVSPTTLSEIKHNKIWNFKTE